MEVKEKYGRLTVIREAEKMVLPSGQKNRAFLCKCDCGNEKVIRFSHLNHGRTTSCGCKTRTLNGLSNHRLYNIWGGMILRTSGKYENTYTLKGIKVCEEWESFLDFYDWGIENGYEEGLQIDRIDNGGDYTPENCRFVTPTENSNNKDTTFYVVYQGNKVSLKVLLREKGIIERYDTIRSRIIRGKDHDEAVDTPIRKGNYCKTNFRPKHKK